MKFRLFALFALVAAVMAGCSSKEAAKNDEKNDGPVSRKVKAEEVIQGGSYSYLRVSEDGKEYWMAIAKGEVEQGKTYYFSKAVEMKSFTSKELKRTFDSILFVEDFSDQPIQKKPAGKSMGRQQLQKKAGIKVEKAAGAITIAELFGNKASYNGKKVKVTGEVVKFNPEIMNKNWVHIQDGTEASGSFDLTITTMGVVKVGDVVTFEGVIALDKDFGAGYAYDLIMEEASPVK